MVDLSLQLRGYRLTTAEILYHLPDHPRRVAGRGFDRVRQLDDRHPGRLRHRPGALQLRRGADEESNLVRKDPVLRRAPIQSPTAAAS